MSTEEILLEEIKHQPEPVLRELWHYLKFLTRQYEEEKWADVLPTREVEQEVLNNATGHEDNQNHSKTRNPNRPDQDPTPASGADASGESFTSIQCVWQTGLSVQRSRAPATTRSLL